MREGVCLKKKNQFGVWEERIERKRGEALMMTSWITKIFTFSKINVLSISGSVWLDDVLVDGLVRAQVSFFFFIIPNKNTKSTVWLDNEFEVFDTRNIFNIPRQ